MSSSPLRHLISALLLTLGLALCLAAISFADADDAPGLGLIGFAVFFGFAFAALRTSAPQTDRIPGH